MCAYYRKLAKQKDWGDGSSSYAVALHSEPLLKFCPEFFLCFSCVCVYVREIIIYLMHSCSCDYVVIQFDILFSFYNSSICCDSHLL